MWGKMIKMVRVKRILGIVGLCGLVFFSGCTGGTGGNKSSFDPTSGFNGGSKALSFTFEKNAPPATVRDQGQQPFSIRFLVKNEGEFDIPEGKGHISLVGVDKSVLNLDDASKDIPALNGFKKQGGSVIEGRQQFVLFSDLKYTESIAGSTQPLNLNANICYPYQTRVSSSLCINGNTNVAIDDSLKICELDGVRTAGVSGGPILVENVKQYVSGSSGISFQFDIVHKPTGNFASLYESGSIDSNCKIEGNAVTSNEANSKKDTVKYEVKSGLSGLDCEGTGGSSNTVRLYDNKYTVICKQDTSGLEEFEKPISITVDYDYLDRITKTITIEHVQR